MAQYGKIVFMGIGERGQVTLNTILGYKGYDVLSIEDGGADSLPHDLPTDVAAVLTASYRITFERAGMKWVVAAYGDGKVSPRYFCTTISPDGREQITTVPIELEIFARPGLRHQFFNPL